MLYDRVLNWGLHIRLFQFNESHIPGSPFPFLVGKVGADPALVLASGKGLTEAACGEKMSLLHAERHDVIIIAYDVLHVFTGKPSKFQVQTVDAGAGVLNVQMDGPSKVRY